GWGLFRRFRGIFLARHLFHHPHEADGVEKAQHQNESLGCPATLVATLLASTAFDTISTGLGAHERGLLCSASAPAIDGTDAANSCASVV
ncbi:MAG TPA: hypothetical protein VG125_19425, partial [Pirellulales bacterium]|nr:hypothetical protein [Pirellulales bacterium]